MDEDLLAEEAHERDLEICLTDGDGCGGRLGWGVDGREADVCQREMGRAGEEAEVHVIDFCLGVAGFFDLLNECFLGDKGPEPPRGTCQNEDQEKAKEGQNKE